MCASNIWPVSLLEKGGAGVTCVCGAFEACISKQKTGKFYINFIYLFIYFAWNSCKLWTTNPLEDWKLLQKLCSHFACRSAFKHNNRTFGGLAMLCKNEFKPHKDFKKKKPTKADFQWIKLAKDFFFQFW